jgi:hypothetical protein
MLRCLQCNDSIHVSCIYKQFKDAGKEALKNREGWLADFILFSNLAYRCKVCQTNHETVPHVSTDTTNSALLEVGKRIDLLRKEIDAKLDTIIKTTDKEHFNPPSYAEVVTTNIVKSAVSVATGG